MTWLEQIRIGVEERSLAGLAWVAHQRGREASLPGHLVTGIEGEDAAFF